METTVGSGSSTLTMLLAELAEVFLKAEAQEDALAAAEAANEESENLRTETLMYANRVLDQDSEISRLKEQVAEAQEVSHVRLGTIRGLNEVIDQLQDEVDQLTRVLDDHHGVPLKQDNRKKLGPAQVGGIRAMVRNGSTAKRVADLYGVHPSTVSRIARGIYYRPSDAAASTGSEGEVA